MEQFYLRMGEETAGPYSRVQIEQFWREARINAKTLYWNETVQEWKPVTKLFIPEQKGQPPAEEKSQEQRRQNRAYRLIHKRTWLVMWLCLAGFFHAFFLFGLAIRLKPEQVGMETIYFHFALVPFLFLAWLSIWRMYKWGVGLLIVYIGLVFYQAYEEGLMIKWIELPVYVVAVFLLFRNWERMRWIRSDTPS